MSELIAMRQRIKAIETIKKITHAMRLISMSTHARVKTNQSFLQLYRGSLEDLLQKTRASVPAWKHPILSPSNTTNSNLVIVVGSQKGLCGNFNNTLLTLIKNTMTYTPDTQIIVIGKKMIELMDKKEAKYIEFNAFKQIHITAIAEKITSHIWHTKNTYNSASVYYNHPATFFLQVPKKVDLIPFAQPHTTQLVMQEDYYWQQDPAMILDLIGYKLLQSSLQDILLQSLTAEQAARFVAMDSSTRNASNLLDAMKLDYNKLRQSKITKELTDLAGSF
jgi:F-type H+-transporting ATPase subunit gamma